MNALLINGFRPGSHQQGGHGVAREVGQRAGFGHETVDAHDDPHAVEKLGAVRLQTSGEGGDAGTRHTCGAFGRDDHEDEQADLFPNCHWLVHGVRNEDGCHGEVNGGTVKVEGIAGGYHDAHGGFVHTHMLHLAHQVRQSRFGRGCCHDEQVLACQVLGQLEHVVSSKEPQHQPQHPKHKHHTGDVERQHQNG